MKTIFVITICQEALLDGLALNFAQAQGFV